MNLITAFRFIAFYWDGPSGRVKQGTMGFAWKDNGAWETCLF